MLDAFPLADLLTAMTSGTEIVPPCNVVPLMSIAGWALLGFVLLFAPASCNCVRATLKLLREVNWNDETATSLADIDAAIFFAPFVVDAEGLFVGSGFGNSMAQSVINILVVNSKGGCGKTTVATNLAAAYANDEKQVALFDCDRQASAQHWAGARGLDLPNIDLYHRPDPAKINPTQWGIMTFAYSTRVLASRRSQPCVPNLRLC